MKKVVSTLILVGGLAMGGTVLANNDSNLDITSDLYETIGLIEQATADLTEDDIEKVLLHDDFAERRLIVLEEVAPEGSEEEIEHLVTDFIEVVTATENIAASAEEAGEDLNELREIINEIIEKRSQNLLALLKRDHLPEQAKAGIRKALKNQERAMEKAAKRWKQELKKIEEIISENEFVEAKEDEAEQSEKHLEKAIEKAEKKQYQADKKVKKAEERSEKAMKKANEKAEKGLKKANKAQEKGAEKAKRALEKAKWKN